MSKARILRKKNFEQVMKEKELLAKLNNPFLMNMQYSFADEENLYFAMDFMTGGDLYHHYHKSETKFTEEQTKFFVACVIQGLEAMHEKKIMHKDIKLQNILFDESGYVRIADFGIAEDIPESIKHKAN